MITREFCAICSGKASAAVCEGCLNEALGYDGDASFEPDGAE